MSQIPGDIVRRAAKTSASVTVIALAAGVRCPCAPLALILGAGGTMSATPRPGPAASSQVMSVPGHMLDLLYQSWPVAPCVRAELHQWADPGPMAESALAGWDAAEIGGAGRLVTAVAAFDTGTYRPDQVLAASSGQYKVETVRARRPRGPSAIACDGQRRWKAYPGRVVVGPAAPLHSDVARDDRLSVAAWVPAVRRGAGGGRRPPRLSDHGPSG